MIFIVVHEHARSGNLVRPITGVSTTARKAKTRTSRSLIKQRTKKNRQGRQPTRRMSFGYSRPARVWNHVWGGLLGWDDRPNDESNVFRKQLLRTGITGGVIFALLAITVLPVIGMSPGSAYHLALPDANRALGLSTRPLVEYPVPDAPRKLEDGSATSTIRTIYGLRSLYASFWPSFEKATETGSAGNLSSIVTSDLLNQIGGQVKGLRANDWHQVVDQSLMNANAMTFANGYPGGSASPTTITGSLSAGGTIQTVAANGSAATESKYVVYTVVTFTQTASGWRISSINTQ